MPAPTFNEADTRAKLIDPALHRARWVEQVVDAERATHGEIRREQSAARIEIIDSKLQVPDRVAAPEQPLRRLVQGRRQRPR